MILFVDVLVKFERPYLLKGTILAIAFIIFSANLISLYFIYNGYNQSLSEIFTISLILTILNLPHLIHFHKIDKKNLLLSIFIFLIKLLSIVDYSFLFQINNSPSLENILTNKIWTEILRLVFGFIYFFTSFNTFKSIFHSLSNKNVYHEKINNWTKYIIFSFILIFVCFIFQLILPSNPLSPNIVLIGASTSFSLVLIYRPSFLNKMNLEILMSEKFNVVNQLESSIDNSKLNLELFSVAFFHKAYFSDKKCSIEDFSSKLGVTSGELKSFLAVHFNSTFADLVNKSRVALFVEMIQNPTNNSLTIEGLSEKAGFGSRQNFHTAFKKFHGGNPSDLLKAVDKN